MTKKCTKCGAVKPLGEFYKDKSQKDGRAFKCIVCNRKRRTTAEAIAKTRAYTATQRAIAKAKERAARPEVVAQRNEYFARSEVVAMQRTYRERPENKARAKAYDARPERVAKRRAYDASAEAKARAKARDTTPEALARQRELYSRPENKAKARILQKAYRANPETRAKRRAYDASAEAKATRNATATKRRRSDPAYRLEVTLRNRCRRAIIKGYKSASTLALLGCSWREIREHIEAQFVDGFTWDNYGERWQIDHIIPCSAYDLRQPGEQFKCMNWRNLRPLEAAANISKGDKLDMDLVKEYGIEDLLPAA